MHPMGLLKSVHSEVIALEVFPEIRLQPVLSQTRLRGAQSCKVFLKLKLVSLGDMTLNQHTMSNRHIITLCPKGVLFKVHSEAEIVEVIEPRV